MAHTLNMSRRQERQKSAVRMRAYMEAMKSPSQTESKRAEHIITGVLGTGASVAMTHIRAVWKVIFSKQKGNERPPSAGCLAIVGRWLLPAYFALPLMTYD